MKSSFLDDSFRKNLESALRFGNPILVQDCENYDAILNPVLNRELRRTGGRSCDKVFFLYFIRLLQRPNNRAGTVFFWRFLDQIAV